MKITCEKCSAVYEVDDNRIPPAGLTMKCPRCLASFTVRRPGAGGPAPSAGEGPGPGAPARPPVAVPTPHAAPAPQPGATAAAAPAAGGPRYYFRRGTGKVFGPFVERAIVSMLEQGKLSGDEQVSVDGQSWQALTQVPSFASAVKAASAATLPPGPVAPAAAQGDPGELDLGGSEEQRGAAQSRRPAAAPELRTMAGWPGGPADVAKGGPTLPGFSSPKDKPGAPPPKEQAGGMKYGEIDFGDDEVDLSAIPQASAGVDIEDLPAPKGGLDIADLPAPKRGVPGPAGGAVIRPPLPTAGDAARKSGAPIKSGPTAAPTVPAGQAEIADLPAPKGGLDIADLPAPKRGVAGPAGAPLITPPPPAAAAAARKSGAPIKGGPTAASTGPAGQEKTTDLPAPKGGLDIADLPAPKGGLDLADLPAPKGGLDIADLPAPKGGLDLADLLAPKGGLDIADLPTPKRGAPTGGAQVPPPTPAPGGAAGAVRKSGAPLRGAPPIQDLPAPKGGLELADLPTPKGGLEIADLPTPRREVPTASAPRTGREELVDLPEPKGAVDLLEPRGGIVDLPRPKPGTEESYGPLDDVSPDGMRQLDEIPIALGGAGEGAGVPRGLQKTMRMPWGAEQPDLLTPKQRDDAAPVVDVVAPKEDYSSESEDDVVTFAPPRDEEAASEDEPLVAERSVPEEEEESTSEEAYEEEALEEEEGEPSEERPSFVARLRRLPLLWLGIGAGVFLLVVGLSLGLLTDYGFFGMKLLSGSYGKENRAKAQVSSAIQFIHRDTHRGYMQAVGVLDAALTVTPDSPEARALKAQALASLLYRFGNDPAKVAQLHQSMGPLAKADPLPEVEKARAMAALAGGRTAEAMALLKKISTKEPADPYSALYLGWAQLAAGDPQAALPPLDQALAADSSLPGALLAKSTALALLGKNKDAEAVLQRALSAVSNHPGALLGRAKLLLQGGSTEEAATLLAAVSSSPEAAPSEIGAALAHQGEVAMRAGQINRASEMFRKALTLNPLNATAVLGSGQLLFDGRRYAEALPLLQRARGLDPTNTRALAMVAHTTILLGKLPEGRGLLAELIRRAPTAPEIPLLQGMLDESAGNWSAAESYFKKAIEKNPAYFESYHHLAQVYLKQSKTADAESVLQQAESKIPGSAAVRSAQGEVLYAAHKLDEARKKLEEALALDNDLNQALFLLASVLSDQGQLEEAKKKFLLLRERDRAYLGLSERLGAIHVQLKEYDKAVAEYELALATPTPRLETRTAAARAYLLAGNAKKALEQSSADPSSSKNPECNSLRAQALLALNKPDEAYTDIKLALDQEKKADYYVTLGKSLEAMKRPAESIDAYGEALKLDKSLTEVRLRRGVLLVKAGSAREGLGDLEDVVKKEASAEAYYYLGVAQEDLRQDAQALRFYQTALSKDSKYAPAHFKLGQMYADQSKTAEAQRHLELAVKQSQPTDSWQADAYYLLGKVSLERGLRKQAIEAYQTFIKLAPATSGLRQEVQARLKSLGIKAN